MNTLAKLSAEHWIKDVLEPLKAGLSVINSHDILLFSNSKELMIGEEDCELCKKYINHQDNHPCEFCPLRAEGGQCRYDYNDNLYGAFFQNPCLETAQAMVDKLLWIAENYNEEGNRLCAIKPK